MQVSVKKINCKEQTNERVGFSNERVVMNNWNGKKNGTGADCKDGVYYYILSGPKLKESKTGFVELIRGK